MSSGMPDSGWDLSRQVDYTIRPNAHDIDYGDLTGSAWCIAGPDHVMSTPGVPVGNDLTLSIPTA